MRHLDAFPRFLLKLPFVVRLGVAVLCVAFFLSLFMMVSPAARTPSMLAIPVALVGWMFRKRGVFICLAAMVLVLWVFYGLKAKNMLLSHSMIISFISATLALVVVGFLVSLLRDSLDVVDAARLQSARALEQEQQLNWAKDQLILNVNHELRTPLTAISGYIEILLEYNERLDAEARLKYLKHAMDGCDDLQMLIGNILDALRIDSGEEYLNLQGFSALQAVRACLKLTDPGWLQSHHVRLDISEELVILANEQYFRQVLRNLLSNALKYTPADTEVLVSAGPYDDAAQPSDPASQVCIRVKDAGPGIPPDELSSLFGQFVRLKRDISGQVRGSGLGLYLSKQMVEAMGGRIWVESAGIPGQGSCFCFTLPALLPQTSMNSSLREKTLPFVEVSGTE
jgi:signal transduction histidine kinase